MEKVGGPLPSPLYLGGMCSDLSLPQRCSLIGYESRGHRQACLGFRGSGGLLCPTLAPELGIHPLYHHLQRLEWGPLKALSFRKFLPELTQQKAVVSLLGPLDTWGLFSLYNDWRVLWHLMDGDQECCEWDSPVQQGIASPWGQ